MFPLLAGVLLLFATLPSADGGGEDARTPILFIEYYCATDTEIAFGPYEEYNRLYLYRYVPKRCLTI